MATHKLPAHVTSIELQMSRRELPLQVIIAQFQASCGINHEFEYVRQRLEWSHLISTAY